ncbi:MAG: hypothetical protein HDT34_00085 [Clostridiales bacterium]|nr:hypothetical protein [Clostridiales bacterium]
MKNYVEVTAVFDKEGVITPVSVKIDDDRFDVDRVMDIRPAASLKSGGAGIRYTCRIEGRDTYLFLEETRWFLELVE